MKNFNEYLMDEQHRMKRGNRYSKIHILFRELAKKKGASVPFGGGTPDVAVTSHKIKKFWKGFFGIDSLTELSDQQLIEFEEFIGKRIQHESKH